jgi:antitoxin component YwqK of YwqJK toxin-antitoxin module
MQRYLVLFLLLAFFNANAQKRNDFLESYKHTISIGESKTTFQLLPFGEEVIYISPQKKYYWFANNQIKITQGGFSGKLLHGSYVEFYPNNSPKLQGNFNKGLKEGEWKEWTQEGTLISQTNFKAGIIEGNFSKYDLNGNLIEEGEYRNGQLNGRLTKYLKDSISVSQYKNGILLPNNKKSSWLSTLFSNKNKKIK